MNINISFGIIVLNGEPFTRYCLRSIYPFAYEIIIVEGGHKGATSVTTQEGHSLDGTIESLMRFKREEDPENKVRIITKDGYWPQKDEFGKDRTPQSREYANLATGNYLWQVDIDEFYKPEDIKEIISLLQNDPSITAISFPTYTFWGDIKYTTDCWALRRGASEYHRLFKWGPNYKYLTHEPPTVADDLGRDLRSIKKIDGKYLKKKGIYMYHYSLLFPLQVRQKSLLYQDEKPNQCKEILIWAENNYFHLRNPCRVHNIYLSPSWLDHYPGTHPPEIYHMMEDIRFNNINVELRPVADIEDLLNKQWYFWVRALLKIAEPIDLLSTQLFRRIRKFLRTFLNLSR